MKVPVGAHRRVAATVPPHVLRADPRTRSVATNVAQWLQVLLEWQTRTDETDRYRVGRSGGAVATNARIGQDQRLLVQIAMRVIGYVRVSTEEQASHGVSLAAQTEKVRAYCALYDLELVELIDDPGASAKTLARPGLARALAALDRGDADGLVVAKLDRLTRSVADMATLVSDYFGERAGKSLFSVADSIDTRTAAGRMVLNILVTVSQWEREAIGERTRDALRHKRAIGEAYGPTPLGYRQGRRAAGGGGGGAARRRRGAAPGAGRGRRCARSAPP